MSYADGYDGYGEDEGYDGYWGYSTDEPDDVYVCDIDGEEFYSLNEYDAHVEAEHGEVMEP